MVRRLIVLALCCLVGMVNAVGIRRMKRTARPPLPYDSLDFTADIQSVSADCNDFRRKCHQKCAQMPRASGAVCSRSDRAPNWWSGGYCYCFSRDSTPPPKIYIPPGTDRTTYAAARSKTCNEFTLMCQRICGPREKTTARCAWKRDNWGQIAFDLPKMGCQCEVMPWSYYFR